MRSFELIYRCGSSHDVLPFGKFVDSGEAVFDERHPFVDGCIETNVEGTRDEGEIGRRGNLT